MHIQTYLSEAGKQKSNKHQTFPYAEILTQTIWSSFSPSLTKVMKNNDCAEKKVVEALQSEAVSVCCL